MKEDTGYLGLFIGFLFLILIALSYYIEWLVTQ